MPRNKDIEIPGADDLLKALRDPGRNLRNRFTDNPLDLAERFQLKLPDKPLVVMERLGLYDEEKHGPIYPGIRDLVRDVCMGDITSAAVVGPRGGGKSLGVSFIEFYLTFVKLYDSLNLGGSELQADQVYQYLLGFMESDPFWRSLLKGDPLQSKTELSEGAWIRVLTASQKSVRSPHAGGRKPDGRLAGGLLVIDEEAEAAADIVEAALPTINTARPSVNVRCSTFHNAEGSFADLIDHHDEMGYKLYRWDIFDVCEGCECADTCEHAEPCFREDHTESYIDPDTNEIKERLLHRAYCGGRAKYASGWIPMEEVTKLWKRMRRNHGRWEVEAMGSRPSTSGHVIKDLYRFNQNIKPDSGDSLYVSRMPVSICVDWGCHDDQTEILAEAGWKKFSELTDEDKVAQFDKDDGVIDFVKPTKRTVKKHSGELMHFNNTFFDIMVTPNHRMLSKRQWDPKWRVERADEVCLSSRPIARDGADWTGVRQETFTLPGVDRILPGMKRGERGWAAWDPVDFNMDDWLELLGYMLSEGGLCYRKARNGERRPDGICIAQRDPIITKKIQVCLDSLGVFNWKRKYTEDTGDTWWGTLDKRLKQWWLAEIGTLGRNKRIPRFVFDLDKDQLRILYTAMMDGDGCWNLKTGGGEYNSTSEGLCSDFQELAIRLGYRAKMTLRRGYGYGNRNPMWGVYVSPSRDRSLPDPTRVPYEGNVYCCTVPKEFIVTRRNGKVAYQGNTTAAGISVWQSVHPKHKLLYAEELQNAGQSQVFGTIFTLVEKYKNDLIEVACDIGGGGNYLNKSLSDEYGLPVREVNFQQEKEAAVAAWNMYNEANECEYPEEFGEFIHQVRNWKRSDAGVIKKGNDHLCDSAVCYFSKFIEELGLRRGMRMMARTFNSGAPKHAEQTSPTRHVVIRRPMIRSIGSSRKK